MSCDDCMVARNSHAACPFSCFGVVIEATSSFSSAFDCSSSISDTFSITLFGRIGGGPATSNGRPLD